MYLENWGTLTAGTAWDLVSPESHFAQKFKKLNLHPNSCHCSVSMKHKIYELGDCSSVIGGQTRNVPLIWCHDLFQHKIWNALLIESQKILPHFDVGTLFVCKWLIT
jgi:hypothetical protein